MVHGIRYSVIWMTIFIRSTLRCSCAVCVNDYLYFYEHFFCTKWGHRQQMTVKILSGVAGRKILDFIIKFLLMRSLMRRRIHGCCTHGVKLCRVVLLPYDGTCHTIGVYVHRCRYMFIVAGRHHLLFGWLQHSVRFVIQAFALNIALILFDIFSFMRLKSSANCGICVLLSVGVTTSYYRLSIKATIYFSLFLWTFLLFICWFAQCVLYSCTDVP